MDEAGNRNNLLVVAAEDLGDESKATRSYGGDENVGSLQPDSESSSPSATREDLENRMNVAKDMPKRQAFSSSSLAADTTNVVHSADAERSLASSQDTLDGSDSTDAPDQGQYGRTESPKIDIEKMKLVVSMPKQPGDSPEAMAVHERDILELDEDYVRTAMAFDIQNCAKKSNVCFISCF